MWNLSDARSVRAPGSVRSLAWNPPLLSHGLLLITYNIPRNSKQKQRWWPILHPRQPHALMHKAALSVLPFFQHCSPKKVPDATILAPAVDRHLQAEDDHFIPWHQHCSWMCRGKDSTDSKGLLEPEGVKWFSISCIQNGSNCRIQV